MMERQDPNKNVGNTPRRPYQHKNLSITNHAIYMDLTLIQRMLKFALTTRRHVSLQVAIDYLIANYRHTNEMGVSLEPESFDSRVMKNWGSLEDD